MSKSYNENLPSVRRIIAETKDIQRNPSEMFVAQPFERKALEALAAFFPTDGSGALGSLNWSTAKRKELAKKSLKWHCDKCSLDDSSLRDMGTKRLAKQEQQNAGAEDTVEEQEQDVGSEKCEEIEEKENKEKTEIESPVNSAEYKNAEVRQEQENAVSSTTTSTSQKANNLENSVEDVQEQKKEERVEQQDTSSARPATSSGSSSNVAKVNLLNFLICMIGIAISYILYSKYKREFV